MLSIASKSSSNKLDVYFPTSGSGPFPTIVMIHGGGFSGGDKGGNQCMQNPWFQEDSLLQASIIF